MLGPAVHTVVRLRALRLSDRLARQTERMNTARTQFPADGPPADLGSYARARQSERVGVCITYRVLTTAVHCPVGVLHCPPAHSTRQAARAQSHTRCRPCLGLRRRSYIQQTGRGCSLPSWLRHVLPDLVLVLVLVLAAGLLRSPFHPPHAPPALPTPTATGLLRHHRSSVSATAGDVLRNLQATGESHQSAWYRR